MNFNLTGKTVLITGASGGIGGAIATYLHGLGAHIILTGRNQQALETAAEALKDRYTILTADLSDETAVQSLIDQAQTIENGVDILVNNAGLTADTLALRMKKEQWDQVLQVNLTSCFLLSKAVLRGMMKKKWGRIINISSVVGQKGNPGQANYCAAKAGLEGMSRSLAYEVASRGITVNCVAPGYVETNMTADLSGEALELFMKNIPAGRPGKPEDIASAVAYLASDEAGYMTGQTLQVNGGLYM